MYDRILVPIDGSRAATRALGEALRFTAHGTVHLRLIHVIEDTYAPYLAESGIDPERLDRSMREAAERLVEQAAAQAREAGADVETEIIEADGRPLSRVIGDDAQRWRASLIAMGTHGRHGIEHMILGSVAEGVARTASAPLLLVRDPGD